MQAVLEHPFLKRAVDATQLKLNKIEQQMESLHGKVDAYRPPMDPLWTPMDPPLGPSYATRWTP